MAEADPTKMPAPDPEKPEVEDEEVLKLPPAALTQRVTRDRNKFLRETFGTDDAEQLKSVFAKTKKLEEDAEAAKKASMSETDRLRAEKTEEENLARAAKEEADAASEQAWLTKLAASKGIRDTDLAIYRIKQKQAATEAGEELDPDAFLEELLKEPSHRAAFGVTEAAAPTDDKKKPGKLAGTSPAPAGKGSRGAPPPQKNGSETPTNFMDLAADDPKLAEAKRHYGI